jgi:hypothetical protein
LACGEPRLTADIDVVLLLKLEDIAALKAAFPESDYYVPPDETLRSELARGGMFNVIHHGSQFKADIYIAAGDSLHAWALEHRRRIDREGSGAWIAPPEYVILRKLEFLREGGSDKHVRDIRFMRTVTTVDREFLDAEIASSDCALATGAPSMYVEGEQRLRNRNRRRPFRL